VSHATVASSPSSLTRLNRYEAAGSVQEREAQSLLRDGAAVGHALFRRAVCVPLGSLPDSARTPCSQNCISSACSNSGGTWSAQGDGTPLRMVLGQPFLCCHTSCACECVCARFDVFVRALRRQACTNLGTPSRSPLQRSMPKVVSTKPQALAPVR
jgi:hypothetical protein